MADDDELVCKECGKKAKYWPTPSAGGLGGNLVTGLNRNCDGCLELADNLGVSFGDEEAS
jgi:hypothetical protein